MAIKVLKEGGPRKVKCHVCKSELEYEHGDIKVSRGTVMGDSQTDWYITCPKCKNTVFVKP